MRIIATTVWCVLLTLPLFAQREVSITGNPELEAYHKQQNTQFLPTATFAKGLEKNDCTLPEEMDFQPLTSGATFTEILDLDTTGLGENGAYTCLDCDMLSFGTVSFMGDTLIYETNPGLSAETETFTVGYCNSMGTECSDQQSFSFLIRRSGLNTFPPVITVAQNEVVQLTATNNLPGALRCNFIDDCVDNYEGRDQECRQLRRPGPSSLLYGL